MRDNYCVCLFPRFYTLLKFSVVGPIIAFIITLSIFYFHINVLQSMLIILSSFYCIETVFVFSMESLQVCGI